MIALLLLGLLVAVGIATILGWTTDSRDDDQKLWPLRRTWPSGPNPPVRDRRPDARWNAVPQPAFETIAKQGIAR